MDLIGRIDWILWSSFHKIATEGGDSSFMWSWVSAGVVCVLSIAAEAAFAGKDTSAILKGLRQPRWAPPMWGWHLVGIAYYAACLFVLQRLFDNRSGMLRPWCLGLLIMVMIANAGWNFVFFRLKDLKWSFWFFVPYAALVAALVLCLANLDGGAALVFGLYATYLPFAMAWMHRVRALNQDS